MTRARHTTARGRPRLAPSAARAGALLGLVIASLILYGLTSGAAFAIRRVDVSPLRWTDRAAVLERLGVADGDNAFRLSTADLPARLAGLPAVLDATVRVTLPDTLVVGVTERTPILGWRVGDALFLVDRDGVLMARAAPGADVASLPIVGDERAASAGLVVGSRLEAVDLDAATRLASLTPESVGSAADGLAVRITDTDGFVLTTSPASWTAVFGPYGSAIRSPELIPGQVRLLRSLLSGRETQVARIALADEQSGTYVPQPSGH